MEGTQPDENCVVLKTKAGIAGETFPGCSGFNPDAWTMTANLIKAIDGVYTRMLRDVHQVSWRDHITNMELYGNLSKLSTKIQQRWVTATETQSW